MDNPDGEQIVKQYSDWLRGEFRTDSYNSGVCEITLPFLNRRGTYLQVYVKRTDSGLMISDYGETIGDLRFLRTRYRHERQARHAEPHIAFVQH